MSQQKALFTRLIAAFILIAAVVIATAARPDQGAPSLNFQPSQYPFKFVVYGDLRETDPSNTTAADPVRRKALIDKIADEHPAFVGVTGDLALTGSNAADWAQWDKETKVWSGLEIFPIIGNHDVRGDESQALANFFKRFPQLNTTRLSTGTFASSAWTAI